MKLKSVFSLIIGLLPIFINAQTTEKGKIGLNYSLNGGTSVIQPALEGAASKDITAASGIGLIYLKPINPWLEWETG
nr:hypothetical protein [Paludibacteraceae bacterium]